MHVIGKRSHPCYTMHVFVSSNTAKKTPFTIVSRIHIISESVCVCPPHRQPDGLIYKEALVKSAVGGKKYILQKERKGNQALQTKGNKKKEEGFVAQASDNTLNRIFFWKHG